MKNFQTVAAKLPKPPATLTTEGKRWWRKIMQEYEITDQAGLLILQTGLESFDRMRQAQSAIAAEGSTVKDRFGQLKAHPLSVVERDSRAQMLASLRQLNLDLEPSRGGPGRPPGWRK